MAEDFGDYSGEKLFDWILRMGQDAGGSAAMSAADKFKQALDNARNGVESRGQEGGSIEFGGQEVDGATQWAKLDMHEFTSIEDWPTLQDIINGKLDDCGIAHDWYREGEDRTYLLFRAEDAPELVRAFDEMSQDVDVAKERASQELSADFSRVRDRARDIGRDHDKAHKERAGSTERRAEKAEMARAAADELHRNNHEMPDRERAFDREKVQGR